MSHRDNSNEAGKEFLKLVSAIRSYLYHQNDIDMSIFTSRETNEPILNFLAPLVKHFEDETKRKTHTIEGE